MRVGDDAYLKPADVLCPHLGLEDGGDLLVATCAVHDAPWYRDTACYATGSPRAAPWRAFAGEPSCPVGALVAARPSLRTRLRDAPRANGGMLQHLGPWTLVPRRGG